MNRIFFIIAITLSIIFPYQLFAKSQSIDNIIVIVNDDIITRSEFNKNYFLAKTQFKESNAASNKNFNHLLKKQVLDELINKKLLLQLSKQYKIEVSPKEVDQALAKVAQENKISVTEMLKQIKQLGISETDYRKEAKEQLILIKLKQQELSKNINIKPEEVNAEIRKLATNQIMAAKEYYIEDFLIPLSDEPTSQEIALAKTNALQLIKDLKQEKNEIRWLKQDLDFRSLGEMPSAYTSYISKMKLKSVAGPIQTGNGFHVIRLKDLRGNKINRQTLKLEAQQSVYQSKTMAAMKEWMKKIRAESYIKIQSEKL